MAQPPPDQNFYHHTLPHQHPHQHQHSQHGQLQLPPQFRNPFDLLYDDRTGAINYNYIRPYLQNQIGNSDDLSEALVMRRPRRTRTTFTSSQIAELEQHFQQGRYLTAPRLADLSAKLALGTAQVKIWFKNRRRRHKIQSNQHKDQSYDGMPMSPTMSTAPQKGTDGDPPSLQALNLGGGGATPNTLTPSPTPSTTSAQLAEHYCETFNSYYNYNNHQTQANGHQRHMAQYPSSSTTNAAAQFFPSGAMQQHGNPHARQQHHQEAAPPTSHHQQSQQLNHHHAMAQQRQQQQQQYHHFEFQQKRENACRVPQVKSENESDFNFNGSYYMRTTPLGLAGVASGTAAVEAVTSKLSPGSEVYEPLTPKNDESPSLCGGGPGAGVGVGGPCTTAIGATDDMDDESNKKTRQNLESLKSDNVAPDKYCDGGRDALGTGLLAVARGISNGNNSNSVFAKFGKFATQTTHTSGSSVNSMHDTNQFQCTMDTIMHAYNPHRNATGNTQFAFCFN